MIWMDVDTALAEVPVNICPLITAADFITVDEGVTWNEAGMELYWHFVTTAGATTVVQVTPTTGGAYDWAHQDHGMYTIEMTATGGASANNDTEGFGYFTGKCTATLAWRGPTIGFRAAALNNAYIDGGDVPDVSVTEIGGVAQRATDLAEIAQYFIANSAEPLGTYVDDDSLYAKMLCGDGDISAYDDQTDSLEAIRDAITAGGPVPYHPDASSTINTGNQDANTYADCAADNGTRWTIGDENGDSGAGGDSDSDYTIDVITELNIGTNRVATGLEVNGYFNRSGGGGYVVEIWAWSYTMGAWVKISGGTADTEMQDRASDKDYNFSLGSQYTDPNTAPGEVKINFRSTRATTAGGDVLYLDHVQVDTIASGATSPDVVADAVWEHPISSTATALSAGYFLRRTRSLITTVASGSSTTVFTLTDGIANADAHIGAMIQVEDATDDHYETRRVIAWTSGKQVTVDRAFSFTPASGDAVYVWATGYGDVNVTHLAASAIQQSGGYVKVSAGTGTGQISLSSGLVTLNGFDATNAARLEDILDGTGGTGIKVNSIENTGTTTLTGAVSLGSTLGVTGATTLASLGVTGALTTGSITNNGTLTQTGAVTLSSTLGVGAVTLASLAITGALSVGTTTTLTGAVSLGSTLGVTGATTLASLGVTGALTAGSITNNGTLTQTGAVTLSSTLAVGATTLSSLAITNALSVGTTTTLTGAVSLGSTLGVTGATTLSGAVSLGSTLGVTGATTFTGAVTCTNGIVADITGSLSGSIGSVGTGGITATSLGADCITAAKIADDAFVAANFATGCLTADAYAADALVAATFATGAFTADAFAADALVAGTFATGAFTADAFAADALVAATFATDSFTADALAADAVAEIAASAGGGMWDALLASHVTADTFGEAVGQITGVGTNTVTITCNDFSGDPIEGAEVWITTDEAGTDKSNGPKYSTAMGTVVFQMDDGTYYAWKQKSGQPFDNPEEFTVEG